MWIVVQEVYKVRWLSVSGYKFSKKSQVLELSWLVKQMPIDQSKCHARDATKLFLRGKFFRSFSEDGTKMKIPFEI